MYIKIRKKQPTQIRSSLSCSQKCVNNRRTEYRVVTGGQANLIKGRCIKDKRMLYFVLNSL